MDKGMGLLAELQRRNVLRMAGLYLAGAWLVLEVATTLLAAFEAPPWAAKACVLLLALGFPLALAFSWIYQLTPEGLKRDAEVDPAASIGHLTGQRMEHLIVVVLALAVGYFALDKFVFAPGRLQQQEARIREQARLDLQARHEQEAALQSEHSIAVLPFVNSGGDPDNEYLADGLAEELIGVLGKVDGLRVIARGSSFQFRDRQADSREIGRVLGVAYLLEGSVQRAAERLRINVRLVKAADGSATWAQRFDREMGDIFAVQSEIAATVAGYLKLALKGRKGVAEVAADEPPNGNVEAYQALLLARHFHSLGGEENRRKAIGYLQRAVALEPGYAIAHATLARAHVGLLFSSEQPELSPAETRRVAYAALAEAKRLAPEAGYVLMSEGMLREVLDIDVQGAARLYRHALQVDPGNARILERLVSVQAALGDLPGAVAGYEKLLEADPLNSTAWAMLGYVLQAMWQPEKAEKALRRAVELGEKSGGPFALVAIAQAMQGREAEALEHAAMAPEGFWRNYAYAVVNELRGERAQSQQYLDRMIAGNAHDAAVQIAQVYALRKQPEDMFRWLQHARKTRDPGLTELHHTPFLVEYRQDPRFQALLRELKLMPEDVSDNSGIPINPG